MTKASTLHHHYQKLVLLMPEHPCIPFEVIPIAPCLPPFTARVRTPGIRAVRRSDDSRDLAGNM